MIKRACISEVELAMYHFRTRSHIPGGWEQLRQGPMVGEDETSASMITALRLISA